MLRKFIEIKNVGKFHNCSASGDVELKKLNVIYGENGRGKTTLCDILRSLKTGNGEYLVGRQTLGYVDQPFVNIRLDSTNATFDGNNWNNVFPSIEIFDSTFVHENVHAGEYVDHDHKKNLYKVIVGARGVELSRKVEELDSKIRDVNREITDTRSAIQRIIPQGINFDAFIALEELADVDKVIQDKEVDLAALNKANEILQKDILQKIIIPDFPAEFQQVITRSIESISKDAEKTIHEHLHQNTNNASEEWLASGLGYVKDSLCPFCAQSIDKSDIITAYNSYFSQSYKQLKADIASVRDSINGLYNETFLVTLSHMVSNNITLCDYWKQYLKPQCATIDTTVLSDALRQLVSIAQQYISNKLESPLEQIRLGDDFWEALHRLEEIKKTVAQYNSSIDEINRLVTVRKTEIKSGDSARIKNDINTLKARKRRYEEDAKHLCETFSRASETKRPLEQEKEQVKTELDNYANNIFNAYEARINKLLEQFGAGFRITETKRRYIGGTASSHYQILINNVAVDLGDSSSPINQPSFRNTLSAGDKSTLALAFFISQLEGDPALSEKVIVLDDPFSSLDRSRRTCTKQLILSLSQKAKQAIVLSHDPQFLKHIWDGVPLGQIKAIQLCRLSQNTTITEWDIERETRDDYYQKYEILTDYLNNGVGDRVKVAMTIRPLLEQYLRFKFPGQFLDTEWLGDFIKKIREAQNGSQLSAAKPIREETGAINDYSKKYHHDTNPSDKTEPIDDGELQTYVKRTLEVVGGF